VRKLDLIVLAAIMVGLVWIEHDHRIVIGSSAAAEAASLAASACPDNDSVPFSADCIAFIGGDISLGVGPHGVREAQSR
jgi:hypothetical protein